MAWREPAERHSEDLVAAIERATHAINHTLREGFKLLASTQTKPGVDNSAAIEDSAKKLKDLTATLKKSLPR